MLTGEFLNERYQVISKISIKGYRQKWLAMDTTQDKQVLIETLNDDLLNDERAIDNIRYELHVSKLLNHDLFPKCIDTFINNSQLYLVWKEFDYESLNSFYENKNFETIPVKEIIQIIFKISSGMSYAHKIGVFHENINGDNIVIKTNNEPMIINLSVNNSLESTDPGANFIFSNTNLCAPERKSGASVNQLSDFYSIGMIAKILLVHKRDLKNNNLYIRRLRSFRPDLDLKLCEMIDGLISPDLSIRRENISKLLDQTFLDADKTPISGIPIVKLTKAESKKINKQFNKPKYSNIVTFVKLTIFTLSFSLITYLVIHFLYNS
ncbi:MAG: protein kinase [Acidimicrobiia bacterium]|nr:protein kinase [Acidimicrobiia bacterium]